MFIILKLIIFNCSFSTKVTCAFLLQESIKEQLEFEPRKTTTFSTILIR